MQVGSSARQGLSDPTTSYSCGVILCLKITILNAIFPALRWNSADFLQFTSFNDDVVTCTPESERDNCASLHALQYFL